MKTIGIVTIVDYNYGNRLQNYALYSTLTTLGYNVKTIPKENFYKIKKMAKLFVKTVCRKHNNWELMETNIPYSVFAADKIDTSKCDYFVAGSDQIWNPIFGTTTKREFLNFAKPEQRVAYAASIGLNKVDDDFYQKFGDEIKKFKAISVREASAVDIVKKVYDDDVSVVVDPVLLLTADKWSSVTNNARIDVKERYVCSYFLGNKDNECVKAIYDGAKEKNYKIIDILSINRSDKGKIGPLEFVKCIKNSEFVVTDSFHATVFSIIFKRPFIAINRSANNATGDMSTRLISILRLFGFENRFVQKVEDLPDDYWNCDFSGTDEIIENERKKSLEFLKNSFEK